MEKEQFVSRHIGPNDSDRGQMLQTIGVKSVSQLIDETVPASIRLKRNLNLSEALTEQEYLRKIEAIGNKNKVFKTYIGQGYYGTHTPSVIQRNIFENPGWYTAYTPYQAEISQGRLEALLNYQTMVMDLTGLPIANASLLDEATAAAESMIMFYNTRKGAKKKSETPKFFVANNSFKQTKEVLVNRAEPLGIELVFGDIETIEFTEDFFGAFCQYPDWHGRITGIAPFLKKAEEADVKTVVASDLLALALITPPGEMGADAVVGNSQRFGVPMGFGGPHAAFFACKDEFKRSIPGRIIGISKDRSGNPALRMALQTREQHIRRDKATSNICTAQALLAVMAGSYAVYHGPAGIKRIAANVHQKAVSIAQGLEKLGFEIEGKYFFDTVTVLVSERDSEAIKILAEDAKINFRYIDGCITISADETTTFEDVNNVLAVFAKHIQKEFTPYSMESLSNDVLVPEHLTRTSEYLTHPVFNSYHSESEMMRYLKKLENRDISLCHSMIPLGSCTMKLNAASELIPLSWPTFAHIHPFAPAFQTIGYRDMLTELESDLKEITGFDGVSLQPNSGAQGEYAGLMVIREYHKKRGDANRNICLIPSSAHGTNPASAVMAGMKVVVTKCDEQGNIDVADLKAKAELHKDNLGACMITYPSTHGVFEEAIIDITSIIHENGGLVYMDGANMNAQVGLTSPGNIGADVCHLNLHKTFAIPHGGGGPGMGPIGVAEHLVPYLPEHPEYTVGGVEGIKPVSAAPWGSALILLISYGYIKMLGGEGLKSSTEHAILNANYIKARVQDKYDVLYTGANNRVAHEMIVDLRPFKAFGVEAEDVAKRLIDYGFHAPTLSFPVAGTIMVEPTESESKAELDRFCDALLSIREEIEEVANGIYSNIDNVLKMAPHTAIEVTGDEWNHAYARSKAAYPLSYIRDAKFWPSVDRVDNAHGDRNLVCSCAPIEDYMEEVV